MTIPEYDELREACPELKLPVYWRLWPEQKHRLMSLSKPELIASRTAVLLRRDIGITDALRTDFSMPEI
jgi:hypothetical protein